MAIGLLASRQTRPHRAEQESNLRLPQESARIAEPPAAIPTGTLHDAFLARS
jgi:hypothetical protein